MLREDFQTAPKQLFAIIVGESFGEIFHDAVVDAGGVKTDVLKVFAADAGDWKCG